MSIGKESRLDNPTGLYTLSIYIDKGTAMIARVQKWGNSLGVRIPKAIAQDARIEDGASVELSVEEGRVVIAPVKKKKYTLKELVDRITPENMHGETDWGPPLGKEVW